MLRIFSAILIGIFTIVCAVILYIWIGNEEFGRWFDRWLLIGATTFFLAAGILLAALLVESAFRRRQQN